MIYTTKIKDAIHFAIDTHEVDQKQKRKGKDISYITHPLTVGLILARAGASEEVVAAGILHDTIEDSIAEKKVTNEMLAERFGKEVASLVESVTEQNKDLPWAERKAVALGHIKDFSHESLLVKSADIVANATELLEDHGQEGDKIFGRFNAPKEKILEHLLKAITAIIKGWPESPLVEDLQFIARELQSIGTFMSMYPASVIAYADYSEDMPLQCPVCGWKGSPKDSGWINTDSHYCMDVSCPNCEKMLLVVSYPLANGDNS